MYMFIYIYNVNVYINIYIYVVSSFFHINVLRIVLKSLCDYLYSKNICILHSCRESGLRTAIALHGGP